MQSHTDDMKLAPPLCVDLDSTLLLAKVPMEALPALLRHNAMYIFQICVWLLQGKAHCKHEIARRIELDAGLLPYHQLLLTHLKGNGTYLTIRQIAEFANLLTSQGARYL
jgi:hypothetical protein